MKKEFDSKLEDKEDEVQRLKDEIESLQQAHETNLKTKDDLNQELRETIDRLVRESVQIQQIVEQ